MTAREGRDQRLFLKRSNGDAFRMNLPRAYEGNVHLLTLELADDFVAQAFLQDQGHAREGFTKGLRIFHCSRRQHQ